MPFFLCATRLHIYPFHLDATGVGLGPTLIPVRDAQEGSNVPSAHHYPETPQTLRQTSIWLSPEKVSCRSPVGQQWIVAGAGALGAVDLGVA